MKFGIIGCQHGHIVTFIEEMNALGHKFIGVCDQDPGLADQLANQYHVPLFPDYRSLFDQGADIIGTASVNEDKIDVIEACAAYGVHVLADKPAVINMDGYNRLKCVMDHGEISIGLMLSERFNPPIYTLWTLINAGVLGDLISITAIKPHKLLERRRPAWHFSRKRNGGILIDLLIHDFDLMHWFTGSTVLERTSYMKKSALSQYPDFFDSAHTLLKMANGTIGFLEADWWIPDPHWNWGEGKVICVGTRGRVEVNTTGDYYHDQRPHGFLVTQENSFSQIELVNPQVSLTEDFIRKINVNPDILITNQDILQASYESIIADQQAYLIGYNEQNEMGQSS
jgi:predicted dehydrogenase